ncbi:exodeoxyribonuclease VII large subunit [Lactobacillus delbrueckii]|uniref:Exodeoxyribonuclease 7 large subunit n=1 Tax=Lactobacillus delbrueckii TaxID=1584 RepID=A0AAW5YU79_9LACO|nr:exodeoxyribonuclease VII large subunit [Lactobacillus delbrueckii]MCT2877957.1 exodeoxyribonuclease VII large subunit [Lactobacillus delbrueckii]MCT3491655.1 exodeoxyribonuclease VII large subunit [Lactobacillus delbrueckii]MDA3767568.1 exodeoxyribonuclease VII large subunit [Lactobacillus delbrueckii]MDF4029406.1 exodeoxyribonuclease VII large subunit [Lactobacillus delbrueckii]
MDSIKGTDEKYLTVSELNWYVKQKFDRDPYLRQIFIQGELSNFRFRRGGHQYFSLKDDKSKINVVMFRGDFDKVKFEPEEGMKVYVTGRLSTYEAQGSYQFYAKSMEPAGLGALYERFRQLQEKLAKEGLFAQEHKRPLPLFPDKIAVVTSASGAVIHDIMVTANRRFPHAEIDLFPAQVQGESAAGSLVSAMQQIQAWADEYDVLIIGRGGGSLEDLWPFNEEEVVRQVYAMKMPVISSVGHETDTTLCDLAADCRAATPTAAAEMATPDLTQVVAEIGQLQTRLLTDIRAVIQVRAQALAQLENSFIMKEPQRLYEQKMQQVDQLSQQLSRMMEVIVKDQGQRLRLLTQRLQHQAPDRRIKQLKQENSYLAKSLEMGIKRILEQKQAACRQAVQQLDDYSPLKTLARGYSYTTDASGTVVKSVQQLSPGDQVRLHLKDGQAIGRIEEIKEEKND